MATDQRGFKKAYLYVIKGKKDVYIRAGDLDKETLALSPATALSEGFSEGGGRFSFPSGLTLFSPLNIF